MNKTYPTKKINSAWLVETDSYRMVGGIKNIIGITVEYNNELLFYSIFDDCFFRALPSKEKLATDWEKYSNQVFVEIYGIVFNKSVGMELFEQIQRGFLTKEEIFVNRNAIAGYYSDLDYELIMDNKVDYTNPSTIDENIINSEPEYRAKMGRPITYDEDHIYGPKKKKKL